MSCNFLWENVKDLVFVLSLPEELQRQIIATISEMDCDMLQQEWAEMDYPLDRG
jgi:hypothetical protein